ncbi:glutamate synthase small subunit-like protein [Serratia fonticola]|uniref:Glutamate synthase small subunit-like protein n=1 Tax=Serratia fonticola TaxID=47917 RepID=A0A542BQS5_SERFO|nr:formate-dependent uric acid utilization protein AegA [Serratia fonticola]TQI80934.1 glutamate synthase small subunit-like protein [Serratia fonticola]TQI97041.1 glutamate synthase small subunit-like protein [Serratia fonticola]TVZ71537.1 glutamate synthase small subunit-like protein [Serratia fonticola]
MNQFIVAESEACIGCRSCEVACVTAHHQGAYPSQREYFTPRVKVIQGAKANTAVFCHHCEDAPCANVCPTGAIAQRAASIHVSQEKCIGCKACAVACPFGMMTVVTETVQPANHRLAESYQKVEAQKCDLCSELNHDPACIRACPTHALRLVDRQTLAEQQKEKRLRAAARDHHSLLSGYAAHQDRGSNAPARPKPVFNLLQQPRAPRLEASKIPLELRKTTFAEIYQPFNEQQIQQQAERCLSCGKQSICAWTCPLHNQIPQWIKLASQGRIWEAAELSHQTSSLPEVCGRVCPQDRLCEQSCTLSEHGGAVTIGNIERYITETAFEMGWRPDMSAVKDSGKRVAIIGAGPAGLGCADILVRHGIKPVVFDRYPEIGGLLTFGIPAFKLSKDVMARRREIFSDMGVEFRLNTEIGKDITMEALLNDYDALFLGVGTYKSMRSGLKNEDAPGVYDALPFLIANTQHLMGYADNPQSPYINMAGKRVIVLGGGDTAMDCVRTALRHGAEQVICAYRRDEKSMPGSKREVKNAREEGAEFMFNLQPLSIEVDDQGHVSGLQMRRTEMGAPDSNGRRQAVAIEGSEHIVPADAVIMAFGFSPHRMGWLAEHNVMLDRQGRVVAPTVAGYPYQTSNRKIFAGGDIVRGADLIVTAIAEGRKAAESIGYYLNVL